MRNLVEVWLFEVWLAANVIAFGLGCATASPTPTLTSPPLQANTPQPIVGNKPSNFSSKPSPTKHANCEALELDLPELITEPFDPPVPPIVDPSARALDPLFERLATLLRGRAQDHVRFAVYGDSNMTKDFITGEMRRILQLKYGDAGHGYLAAGRPWSWYRHMDVEQWLEKRGWKSYAVSTHSVADHAYGFGGIAAESTSIRARIRMATAPSGAPVGTRVSRVQVFYLERPKGLPFSVFVDGKNVGDVKTEANALRAATRKFELNDAPHTIEFRAGGPLVRLFGAALERSKPGVVVDSLGVGGATIGILARMNQDIATASLKQRNYDLIMILTGGTEDDNDAHDVALRKFIQLHHKALPHAPILIMSPIDFAYGTRSHPKPARRIKGLSARKRRVAAEMGCAYWDFHAAMGGELSIVKFASHKMAWNDLVHLTESGGAFMGRRIVYALWKAFESYLEEHPEAGCH